MRQVLLVCKAYPPIPGGVETFSEQLTRAYLRQGLGATVITQTTGPRGWGTVKYPEGDIPIFNTGDGGQAITGLRMIGAIRSATKAKSYDFVHATTWRPGIAVRAARTGLRLVITVHGREVLRVPLGLRPLMESVLRSASLIVAVSNETKRRASAALSGSVARSQWVVLGNGISYPEEAARLTVPASKSIVGDTVNLLSFARLVERKNIQGCITALAALKARGLDRFEYRIAGTGPMMSALQRQVEASGIAGQVRFLGYVDESDVPDLYRWSDVFLHPQIDLFGGEDFEGFGLTIADAMSFGSVAVAGEGSGPSDFIEHLKTGMLVDGADNKAIQDALELLIGDTGIRKRLGASGRAFVISEVSWDTHASGVLTALGTADQSKA